MVYAKASWDDPNMHDYPFLLQAVAGADPISYDAAGWREPLSAAAPGVGVLGNSDFTVTQGAATSTVDVTAGAAVIAGATGVGKYLVRSTGTVNVPVPGAPGSGTRNHLLVAQVLDSQHAGFGATPGWQFMVVEDTGSGATVPASAIPLWKLTRTGTSSTITPVDQRASCRAPMSCRLEHTTPRWAWLDKGLRKAITFTDSQAAGSDPFHMANLSADAAAITLRTEGLWDLFAYASANNDGGGVVGLSVNATNLTNDDLATHLVADSEVTTATVQTIGGPVCYAQTSVLGVHLNAGDVIRAHYMPIDYASGATAPTLENASVRVFRREIRP